MTDDTTRDCDGTARRMARGGARGNVRLPAPAALAGRSHALDASPYRSPRECVEATVNSDEFKNAARAHCERMNRHFAELRHSISSGDGRFTHYQLQAIEAALGEAGGSIPTISVAA